MGVSYRYHMASLVAAFLMLLIGLLVGVGLSSEPRLERAVEQLSARLDAVQDQQRRQQQEIEARDRFARAFRAQLVEGQLAGKTVAVVDLATYETAETRLAREELRAVLAEAGAQVPYTVSLQRDFVRRARDRSMTIEVRLGRALPGQSSPATALARMIGEDVASGYARRRLEVLRRARLLKHTGELGTPVSGAAVITGAGDEGQQRTEEVDVPLLEGLLSGDIRVVACEARAPVSCLRACQQLDIPTVDHIDTVAGQYSAVRALAGANGDFGTGQVASHLFPPLGED
jgi:Flp pilus assembly protein TadG